MGVTMCIELCLDKESPMLSLTTISMSRQRIPRVIMLTDHLLQSALPMALLDNQFLRLWPLLANALLGLLSLPIVDNPN